MRRQRSLFQTKEQDKAPEKEDWQSSWLEMQGNSHNDAHIRGNFSKETENLRKSHAELKTSVTEVKNTVEGMDRRLWGAEERICDGRQRTGKQRRLSESERC